MEDIIIQDTQSSGQAQKKKFQFSLEVLDEWIVANQKMKLKEKVIFFRLLATMVNAGLPVLKSIGILEKQEQNPVLKNIYSHIIEGVK